MWEDGVVVRLCVVEVLLGGGGEGGDMVCGYGGERGIGIGVGMGEVVWGMFGDGLYLEG